MPISPRASPIGLPALRASSTDSSSWRSASASARRCSSRARSGGATARHAGNAAFARATAASASSAPARGISARTSSVAGSRTPSMPEVAVGLEPLEATEALPVGDGRVEGRELDAGVVEVVRDDLLAERLARDGAGAEQLGGVAEGRRHARLVGEVGVALVGRLELELVVDAVQAAGDERREREVGVAARAGHPALDAAARAVADDAQ